MTLAEYVLAAMTAWAPLPSTAVAQREDPSLAQGRYESIATNIADVVSEETEPPLLADEDRSRTAILLAAFAYWEGARFAWWVDAGICNHLDAYGRQAELRAAHVGWGGACDGGIAVSLWQIHADHTIALDSGGGWHWWRDGDGARITAVDLADRRTAARVALHMLRSSLPGHFCGYTGEPGPCPKADARASFARRWWVAHPMPVP